MNKGTQRSVFLISRLCISEAYARSAITQTQFCVRSLTKSNVNGFRKIHILTPLNKTHLQNILDDILKKNYELENTTNLGNLHKILNDLQSFNNEHLIQQQHKSNNTPKSISIKKQIKNVKQIISIYNSSIDYKNNSNNQSLKWNRRDFNLVLMNLYNFLKIIKPKSSFLLSFNTQTEQINKEIEKCIKDIITFINNKIVKGLKNDELTISSRGIYYLLNIISKYDNAIKSIKLFEELSTKTNKNKSSFNDGIIIEQIIILMTQNNYSPKIIESLYEKHQYNNDKSFKITESMIIAYLKSNESIKAFKLFKSYETWCINKGITRLLNTPYNLFISDGKNFKISLLMYENFLKKKLSYNDDISIKYKSLESLISNLDSKLNKDNDFSDINLNLLFKFWSLFLENEKSTELSLIEIAKLNSKLIQLLIHQLNEQQQFKNNNDNIIIEEFENNLGNDDDNKLNLNLTKKLVNDFCNIQILKKYNLLNNSNFHKSLLLYFMINKNNYNGNVNESSSELILSEWENYINCIDDLGVKKIPSSDFNIISHALSKNNDSDSIETFAKIWQKYWKYVNSINNLIYIGKNSIKRNNLLRDKILEDENEHENSKLFLNQDYKFKNLIKDNSISSKKKIFEELSKIN